MWRNALNYLVMSSLSPILRPRSVVAKSSLSRFSRIGRRYAAAMKMYPDARALELAPLRYLMPQQRRVLGDLFAGAGFASAPLRSQFLRTILIDQVADALPEADERVSRIVADATNGSGLLGTPIDLAICVAGFHHVLGASPEGEHSHLARRRDVLRAWRDHLAPGGRLVVADVPATGTAVETFAGTAIPQTAPDGKIVICPNSAIREAWTGAARAHSLRAYLRDAAAVLASNGLQDGEPAAFFDEVVARWSPEGHEAVFASPAQMVALFREAGYVNIHVCVAPTPWVFPSLDEALWFVHELLGLGDVCLLPETLGFSEKGRLTAAIDEYLDLKRLPGGGCALAWKLMYVIGDNP